MFTKKAAVKLIQGTSMSAAVTYMGHQTLEELGFEEPKLLVTLPFSIIKDNLVRPNDDHSFKCTKREALHGHCADANFFDRATIPPVNKYLDKRGVTLTKESLHRIKDDIEHSKQMSQADPVEKKIKDYYKQAEHQKLIADSFASANEKEGAVLHSTLSVAFHIKAKAYENLGAHLEHLFKGNSKS